MRLNSGITLLPPVSDDHVLCNNYRDPNHGKREASHRMMDDRSGTRDKRASSVIGMQAIKGGETFVAAKDLTAVSVTQ